MDLKDHLNTYNQYLKIFGDNSLLDDDLELVDQAIKDKDIDRAISLLVSIYDVAAYHGLLNDMDFPGPDDFASIVPEEYYENR